MNNRPKVESFDGRKLRERDRLFNLQTIPFPSITDRMYIRCANKLFTSSLFFFPNSRFYCLNQPRDRFRISLVQFSRCIRTKSSSKLKFPASNLCYHFLHVRYRVFFLWRTNRFSSWNARSKQTAI